MVTDEMEFNSIFAFGKHKGDMLEDVIEDDPKYMEWLVDNDVVSLASDVIDRLAERKIV